MTIGEKLRALRRKSGLSIAKVAAKASVSPDYVIRIEHGRVTNVGIEKLDRIAKAVNAHVTDLLPKKEKAA